MKNDLALRQRLHAQLDAMLNTIGPELGFVAGFIGFNNPNTLFVTPSQTLLDIHSSFLPQDIELQTLNECAYAELHSLLRRYLTLLDTTAPQRIIQNTFSTESFTQPQN